MTECQHPDCTDDATETYSDPHGNEIELCSDHYADAVLPPFRVSRVVRDRDKDEQDAPLSGLLPWDAHS